MFFFLIILLPPSFTLFPYTTLFRSGVDLARALRCLPQQAGDEGHVPFNPRPQPAFRNRPDLAADVAQDASRVALQRDRKSTRLNSSHANISYAVFCLKKKRICSNSQ